MFANGSLLLLLLLLAVLPPTWLETASDEGAGEASATRAATRSAVVATDRKRMM
jgi:hypothetical protein